MRDRWGIDRMTQLRATLNDLQSQRSTTWTWDDLSLWAQAYKRMNPTTVRKRILQLEFAGRHPQPVVYRGTHRDFVDSAALYLAVREAEGAGPGALVNDHKAFRFLGAFLGIPDNVWPTAPTMPAHDDLSLPSPEMVHELLHTDFFPNARRSHDNALLRHLLAFDFLFGPRFPSEAWALRVGDVNQDLDTIVITEPKKNGRRRLLAIEPRWLSRSRRHLSLEGWLRWRSKVSPKGDAFWVTSEGKPFPSKDALRRWVNRHVEAKLDAQGNRKFPWFNPYLGRHWSVNARLIDGAVVVHGKLQLPYGDVAHWHGHDNVNMTKNAYEHAARLHARLHGRDWLRRAAVAPRTSQPTKTGREVHAARGRFSGPGRARSQSHEQGASLNRGASPELVKDSGASGEPDDPPFLTAPAEAAA